MCAWEDNASVRKCLQNFAQFSEIGGKAKRRRSHFISGITTELDYSLTSTIPSVSYIALFTDPEFITDEIVMR
jgi:hypothetical protein